MIRLILLPVVLLVAAIAQPGLAQDSGSTAAPHQMDGMTMLAPEGASDATRAYIEAMNAMHAGMMMEYTGDADVDFIKGVIPHHQGAVDAAKIALQYGTDPEVRAFAEQVIAAQEAEIAWMTAWLKARGQ